MLLIKVTEQYARKYNDQTLVSDAVNFVPIKFEFDSSWQGLILTYQFTNNDVTVNIASNELTVNIPHEVMIEGTLYVKVSGASLDEELQTMVARATTNPVTYDVISSKLIQTDTTPVTPTLYDQIRQIAEDAYSKVTEIETETSNLVSLKSDMETAVSSSKSSETNAKTSETNASESEDNAKVSENKAAISENNSKISEDNVKISENVAIAKAQIAIDKAAEASVYAAQAQETFETVYNNTASISSTAPTDKNFWLDLNIE